MVHSYINDFKYKDRNDVFDIEFLKSLATAVSQIKNLTKFHIEVHYAPKMTSGKLSGLFDALIKHK